MIVALNNDLIQLYIEFYHWHATTRWAIDMNKKYTARNEDAWVNTAFCGEFYAILSMSHHSIVRLL